MVCLCYFQSAKPFYNGSKHNQLLLMTNTHPVNHSYPLRTACSVTMCSLRVAQAGQDTYSFKLLIIESLRLAKISKIVQVQPLKQPCQKRSTILRTYLRSEDVFFRRIFQTRLLSFQRKIMPVFRQEKRCVCCTGARSRSCRRAQSDCSRRAGPGGTAGTPSPPHGRGHGSRGRGEEEQGREGEGRGWLCRQPEGRPGAPHAQPRLPRLPRRAGSAPLTRPCCWARGGGAAPRPRASRLPRPPPPRGP